MVLKKLIIAAAGITTLMAAPLVAQTTAITPGTLTAGANRTYEMGFQFTANSAISITSLGAFDQGANGLTQAHEVTLWTSTGTQLATASVTNANTLIGSFRYADIRPTP